MPKGLPVESRAPCLPKPVHTVARCCLYARTHARLTPSVTRITRPVRHARYREHPHGGVHAHARRIRPHE
jgi:hypothetical protein